MSRGRLDRTPRDLGLGRLSHSLGASGEGVIVQWLAVGCDPHRPTHPLFDHDVGRSDIGSHRIELPVVRHRPVAAQAPCGLNAQAPVQLAARRTGPMQISGLRRRNGEALIVDRQIARQELIRRVQRGDAREPHLLDHPILKGLKEPLHPPLGLGGVGREQLDSQLAQRPPTLTRGLDPGQLLVHGEWGRRVIGRMFVRVDGQRNPIPSHVAREAVQRGDRPFLRVEPGKHSAARIVDVRHQHATRPAPLEPVMVRAIELHQFAHLRLPLPPRPVWALPPHEMTDPALPPPPPQGLVAEREPMPLGQLLGRQRRPEIPIPLRIQLQHHGLDLVRDPPIRWLASSPMRQPLVARLLHPLDEAPDVAGRQPQHDPRLDLRQLLLHRLANHVHPPEFLHTHDDSVRSDHRTLLVRAHSLATKRTFLDWPKRTLSLWDYMWHKALAGRPSHVSSAQHVEMKVKHALATMHTGIDDDTVSGIGNPFQFRNLVTSQHQMPN